MITYSVKFRELIPRDNNDVRHGLVTCRQQKEKSTLIGHPPSYKEDEEQAETDVLPLARATGQPRTYLTYDNKLN